MQSKPTGQRRFIAVAVLVGTAGFLWWLINRQIPELPSGVSSAEYRLAERELKLKGGGDTDRFDILFRLAERGVKSRRWATAVSCLEELPAAYAEENPQVRFSARRVSDPLEPGRRGREISALVSAAGKEPVAG